MSENNQFFVAKEPQRSTRSTKLIALILCLCQATRLRLVERRFEALENKPAIQNSEEPEETTD
ncbi:MAG: hypothetical protein LBI02_03435 [Opitutaceae bacterium]|jgi:hypothetical protein|nr:hypothetical protein [Opitutaceae bacterium]